MKQCLFNIKVGGGIFGELLHMSKVARRCFVTLHVYDKISENGAK